MVITIAGGGSTFTAGIVKSIALRREELEVDEIRLFDINKERQDTSMPKAPMRMPLTGITHTPPMMSFCWSTSFWLMPWPL